MSYEVKILADSIAPHGVRLTTLQVTFPRFILAEVNTHRMLSRNSASSRAIPPEKQIARVKENPFVPETFNKRVKGMGVGEAIKDQEAARSHWLIARDSAVIAAEALCTFDCDKSRINRLLEPFMWHTAILSGTEWSNFFALRDHPDAQPEFQIIARMMREEMDANEPQYINFNQWHLPLVSLKEREDWQRQTGSGDEEWNFWVDVSAGRCARVSYDTQDNYEEPEKSVARAVRLATSGHLSPFEHPAFPYSTQHFVANFRGWEQARHRIPNEENFAEVLAGSVV